MRISDGGFFLWCIARFLVQVEEERAQADDLLLCGSNEPHGVRVHAGLRIPVTIAPPF